MIITDRNTISQLPALYCIEGIWNLLCVNIYNMGDCNTNFDNLINLFNNPDSDETRWALNLLQISYDKFKQIINTRNSLKVTPSQSMQFKDLICGNYSSLYGYLRNDEWYNTIKLPFDGTLKTNWITFINGMRTRVKTGSFEAPPPPPTHSQSPSRSPEAGQVSHYEMSPDMSVKPVTYSDTRYMPFSHSVGRPGGGRHKSRAKPHRRNSKKNKRTRHKSLKKHHRRK